MLNPADWAWILLAISGSVAAGAYFFSKTRIEPIGVVRGNDFTDEKIRKAVIQAVKGVDVSAMSEEDAEAHLEELARHAIAREYASIYPGLKVEVTEHWPDAKCLISGNIAVIRPWVGRAILGGTGIRAVNVEVNRQPTLTLTTKRPIKDAWEDIHSPPKRNEPVAPLRKVASAPAAVSRRPAPQPEPPKPPKAKMRR